MSSIVKSVQIEVDPDTAWEALRDFGALHVRLARGFVTDCRREGDDRVITFVTGVTLRERLVAIDEERRTLAYTIVDGPYEHHHGVARVEAHNGGTLFEWTNYVLPEATAEPTATAMDAGLVAIKKTLEATPRAS